MHQGQKLYTLLQDKVSTLELRSNLLSLKEINAIIIIGSSWVGKTTIRNILYNLSTDDPLYSFPKRVITRDQRPNDNLDENDFATSFHNLKEKVGKGIIWERDLGETKEYYGFQYPLENTIPIYSANNALLRQKDSLIQNISSDYFDKALIVVVYAPDEERLDRNNKREGSYLDDKPLQKLTRLSDSSESMYNQAHIIVHNHNTQDMYLQKKDLQTLIESIKKIKN